MNQISNIAPLTIGEEGNKQVLKRRFLGNIFPKNTYENKELKAYVKGSPVFNYGKHENGQPVTYTVRQEYYYVPAE